jgi:hypothetical protein
MKLPTYSENLLKWSSDFPALLLVFFGYRRKSAQKYKSNASFWKKFWSYTRFFGCVFKLKIASQGCFYVLALFGLCFSKRVGKVWGGCPSSHKGACSASVRPLFGLCIIRQFLALTIESSTLSYFLFPPTNPIKIISKLCAFSKYISMLMLWYSKPYIIFIWKENCPLKKFIFSERGLVCTHQTIDLHKCINELTLKVQ